ncbi:Coproporphyrinogen dehydrogenase [Desulfofarcimen acetoxidans DSM 771]|uniref:Coproporphyrinogen dehydrogenase n=1 Tax=Desulfofarcimen acetoxidans (strain ATCC 49208 / DSM 771 / KCTC 5769 / VKM B-1644 / 5575) TaxID=485916 RepID=C8W6J8_DESAS|nr:coproporphyrinogen dehydrogenase HemZ [Desulfofarcimen acetoxidans]ACV64107.1 Coproporphyrinogen dehydrogenase [Desulfofarcimen acetoxidans DSM 771]
MTNVFLTAHDKDFLPGMQDVLRLFFQDQSIHTASTAVPAEEDLQIRANATKQNNRLTAVVSLKKDRQTITHYETAEDNPVDSQNESKRLVRLALFRLLEKTTGETPSPWGILTGIRPTKVLQRLFDTGYERREIINKLVAEYAVFPNKAELITSIASVQRKFLPANTQAEKTVSIYIGIPFCPTRCLYCSFTAYPVKKFKAWVEPYLNALIKEIKETGRALKENGLSVQTIYFGGGTPTSINPEQLASLLNNANSCLRGPQTIEVTMEGGRPDTLTEEVLHICSAAGVDRLSINPQTMLDQTLKLIGRNHSVEDIYRAMQSARAAGFPVINMDIIVGLPGENETSVMQTIELLKPLKPENLTVHALALKNASLLKQEIAQHNMPAAKEVLKMWEIAQKGCGDMGMLPYYLYRQKRITGNLENIGYALPGKECIYNIQMIEERQTIIGLGTGGSSKLVQADKQHLNRYNPKDPLLYIERIDELISRKLKEITDQGSLLNKNTDYKTNRSI